MARTYETETAEAHADVAKAMTYLTTRFGAHAADMATRYQLGYAERRLTIPYLTRTVPIDVRARCIADHKCDQHPKYKATKGGRSRLFNAHVTTTSRKPYLFIIEGEIDTIVVDGIVGEPAVGVPGAHALTAETARVWGHLFEDVDIIAVGDGDDAGETFVDTVADMFPQARTLLMPEGEDVNSYWLANGTDALRTYLFKRTPYAPIT